MAGIFVTLEGVDGCGKTTQACLLAHALEARGTEVARVREPGSTVLSEKIRALLLDPENLQMCPECELFLYEAARAQLIRQVIDPALAAGRVVICDRYYDSTYAYQAGGRGLSEELVRKANELGSCGRIPDLTLVLDIEPELVWSRVMADEADRMVAAGLELERRVYAAYQRLATAEPNRVRLVDAHGTIDEVHERLMAALADLLPGDTRVPGTPGMAGTPGTALADPLPD